MIDRARGPDIMLISTGGQINIAHGPYLACGPNFADPTLQVVFTDITMKLTQEFKQKKITEGEVTF